LTFHLLPFLQQKNTLVKETSTHTTTFVDWQKITFMQLPNYLFLGILSFSLLLSNPSTSQLSASDKTAAVQVIAKAIAANYVFPEKGGQIASYIQMANHRGEFEKATNWNEFDSLVTRSLQKFSNDGHLYVRNNPVIVKKLKDPAPEKDDSEQMKSDGQSAAGNNYGFAEVKTLDGNIGYLKISEINISKKSLPALFDAMRAMENTKALIIDLRDNGGGGSELGAVLETYFLPAGMPLLEFTARDGSQHIDSTVAWLKEKKYDQPVYIIINKNTASAAEAFAFVLQQNKRARIVGEVSAGAAYMNDWFPVNDENYVSVSTSAPNIAGKNLSWEQNGVQPDMKVKKEDPVQYIVNKISKK
jgi:hypothetical protein